MGNKSSSESSVKNISNQLFVNKDTINQLNQQLNDVVANTIVKNAMSSGGDIINKQELDFEDLSAKGDINIGGVSQKQVAAVTFSAMNKTQARNDAALQFIQTALDNLKKSVSADVIAKMEGNADSKIKTGFLSSMPLSNTASKSETVNVNNVTSITENVKNISNIVKNRVENNFVTETVTNCITNINNSQVFKVKKASADGSIYIINITQDQAATAVSKCGAIVDATNKIVNDALNALDIKIDETNTVTSKTDQKATSTASTEQTGPIQEFGDAIGQLFSGMMSWIVLGIIIFIIIIAILILIFKFL